MKKKIFDERLRIGKNNQPEFLPIQDDLNRYLETNSIEHPYSLSRKYLHNLCEVNVAFKYGAHGHEAQLKLDNYVYRFASIYSLANERTSWDDSVISYNSAFDYIKNNTKDGSWYKMSKVMSGILSSRRWFSWWTDFDLNNSKNILEDIHRLGIANNWINNKSVILRLNIDSLIHDRIKIPSIIDGFEDIIFLPVKTKSKIASGQTLNIRDTKEFSNGLNELVIKDIPLSAIEVRPTALNYDNSNSIFYNTINFQKSLLKFYKNQ